MHARDLPDDPATPPPLDRQRVDGEAGRGDMLGGLTAGAGGRLGVPDDGSPHPGGVMTIPMAPNQHDLDDVEPAIDTAQRRRGAGDPA